jgi:hypothetical protein
LTPRFGGQFRASVDTSRAIYDAEQVGLVAQHGHIGDRLATIGQHHCQVQRDPARDVAATTLTKPCQRHVHPPGQAGRVGDIRKQPGAYMAGDTPAIRADIDPRTSSGSLHSAGAFLAGVDEASTTVILPAWRALPCLRPADRPALLKGRG